MIYWVDEFGRLVFYFFSRTVIIFGRTVFIHSAIRFWPYGPKSFAVGVELGEISSIHVVFLRNRLYLGRTDVTSFCVHFEKIGRGLLRESKRREGEWVVWAKGGGMNRKYAKNNIYTTKSELQF